MSFVRHVKLRVPSATARYVFSSMDVLSYHVIEIASLQTCDAVVNYSIIYVCLKMFSIYRTVNDMHIFLVY